MRRPSGRTLVLPIILLVATMACTQTARSGSAVPDAEVSAEHCAGARDYAAVRFNGRQLRETPDIDQQDLRNANSGISAHCFDWVSAFLQRYTANHPDDYRVAFLRARFSWVLNDRVRAQTFVESVLRFHPGFTSAKVLRASMAIDDHDFGLARQLLDQIEKEQPDDLWAYIDRLRIEAQVAPTRELQNLLASIVKDSRFPPNARQQVALTARFEVPATQEKYRDEVFADQMKANSAFAACNLAEQATDVIELRLDPKAGVTLIEKYLRTSKGCLGTATVRTLLAEAYLMQAVKIAPTRVAANADLIDKAKAALDGDLTSVAQRATWRPFLANLFALMKGNIRVNGVDEYGQSLLCSSVRALNPLAVKAVLDSGADVAVGCDGETPVHNLLFMAADDKIAERQGVLRELLGHGAQPEGLEFCASPDNGNCREVLLPILQEFQAHPRSPGMPGLTIFQRNAGISPLSGNG